MQLVYQKQKKRIANTNKNSQIPWQSHLPFDHHICENVDV
jgi:hypothetical protein